MCTGSWFPRANLAGSLLLLMSLVAVVPQHVAAQDNRLVVWGQQRPGIHPLLEGFEKHTGIKVAWIDMSSNVVVPRLRATMGMDVDILFELSEAQTQELMSFGLLKPLNPANLQTIPEKYRESARSPRWVGIGAGWVKQSLRPDVSPFDAIEVPGTTASGWPIYAAAQAVGSKNDQAVGKFLKWLQSEEAGGILADNYLLVASHKNNIRTFRFWDYISPGVGCVKCAESKDCDDGYSCKNGCCQKDN